MRLTQIHKYSMDHTPILCCAVTILLLAKPVFAMEPNTKNVSSRQNNIKLSLEGGTYVITIDTNESPDLSNWAKQKLAPVVSKWYPLIVQMLPSKGYSAPTRVEITISDSIDGVAYTSGNRVSCNGVWFKRQLDGEALGAVVHELVHVVQQYRWGERQKTPGWLVEGIPDYIRWFLYEPESGGALINRSRAKLVKHDASYRVSANFIHWVSNKYGSSLMQKLNARLREGRYDDSFWREYTGIELVDLATTWRESLLATELADEARRHREHNLLTEEEQLQGWQLLFDGKTLDGWHSFQHQRALPGWQIKEGTLICADPLNAGDLCTNDEYDWFELRFEYKIASGGNSGVLYHVSRDGNATWSTGPELQLEDNILAKDPTRSGWLYALYQPPLDKDTAQPIDATLPAGQWNRVRLVVSPKGCLHEINGVEYFTYELNSDEFRERVAASKFSEMREFASAAKGRIALQGDHGVVSFRNLKIRQIQE